MQNIDEEKFISLLYYNGTVNAGQFARAWRKQVLQWKSAAIPAMLYSEACEYLGLELEQEDEGGISGMIRTWQRMEQKNKFPTDPRRRLVIATILNLPVAYFSFLGVKTTHANAIVSDVTIPMPPGPLDLDEYAAWLQKAWSRPYDSIKESLTRAALLQHELLYRKNTDQTAALLIEYLILGGNLQRGSGDYITPIGILNDAVHLAHERGFGFLEGKALYFRGYALFERWRTREDREKNHQDLLLSTNDNAAAVRVIGEARQSEEMVSLPVLAAASDLYGTTLAWQARYGDRQDKYEALKVRADALLEQKDFYRDNLFFNIDQDWITIGKAQSLVAIKEAKNAIEEVKIIHKRNPEKLRRYVTATIEEAEAYLVLNKLDMTVAYLEDALDIAINVDSPAHIKRIFSFYERLRDNPIYRKSQEVAHLGVALLKVQRSELFG